MISSTSNTGGDFLSLILFFYFTFEIYVTLEWNLFRFGTDFISSDLLGCSFFLFLITSGELEELDWYILLSFETLSSIGVYARDLRTLLCA